MNNYSLLKTTQSPDTVPKLYEKTIAIIKFSHLEMRGLSQ